MVRPRSCRVIYYFDTPTLERRHQLFGHVTYFVTNELDSYIPSICVSLLQEFEDVFPDEISSGLPPIQGIEYHINVVLGLAIPNRPAYRSNLKERKEFQRQVGELILKGYI